MAQQEVIRLRQRLRCRVWQRRLSAAVADAEGKAEAAQVQHRWLWCITFGAHKYTSSGTWPPPQPLTMLSKPSPLPC